MGDEVDFAADFFEQDEDDDDDEDDDHGQDPGHGGGFGDQGGMDDDDEDQDHGDGSDDQGPEDGHGGDENGFFSDPSFSSGQSLPSDSSQGIIADKLSYYSQVSDSNSLSSQIGVSDLVSLSF